MLCKNYIPLNHYLSQIYASRLATSKGILHKKNIAATSLDLMQSKQYILASEKAVINTSINMFHNILSLSNTER